MRPTQNSDLSALNSWFQSRGWPGISERHMQMKGFIVDDVAAGFLMQTDAGVAYLENYVSNPNARPRDVATAVDQITAALLGLAQAKGFDQVAAFTALPSIEKRAQRLGLWRHDEPYALLTKSLLTLSIQRNSHGAHRKNSLSSRCQRRRACRQRRTET